MNRLKIQHFLPLFLLAGCEPYSPETVIALDRCQAAVKALYASFEFDLDSKAVENVRSLLGTFKRAQEMRGKDNKLMTGQAADLLAIFELHVKHRTDGGPWTPKAVELHTKTVNEAFQIAIRTEEAKRGHR